MIEELRKLGLSELEARCYLALHAEPKISGYEVAKKVSVSRTNVYAALRSLTDKGVCRAIEADPVLYDAVPIEQLVRMLQSDFEQTARTLVKHLKSPPQSAASFYNWQGDNAIRTAIRRLAANADKSIVVDIWAEDVHWVEEPLLEAERRGVFVTLIVIGECAVRLNRVLFHRRSDAWDESEARKFSILCDSRSALLGSFGSTVKLSALETNHPAVVELLLNGFYHDVIMDRVEQDFGGMFTERYGDHYDDIIHPYRKYLD